MAYSLKPGTVLDGRYRVDRMLGEGGFGITYEAENMRIGLKVAIKELFWRSHSQRDAEVSPEVALSKAEDAAVFSAQKARFLREARILRDFSDEPCIVRILDYFEANETAYIVMEYVDGETLSAWLAKNGGRIDAATALRKLLPLIESLARVHASGVIHRDISPDNIMMQADGGLKLIDFGAARQCYGDDPQYTAVAKVSYAPGEQYDKNGRQGPWTDVYALCATLYHCVTGAPPDSAVQRLFLDELKTPSEMGIPIDPACEGIIMKGLSLSAGKRYQSMEELASAIRAVLPEEKPEKKPGSRAHLILAFLAGAACVALALALLVYRQYDASHKFRGVTTESVRLTPEGDMSAQDFAQAQVIFRGDLDDFAGKDNYIMQVDGLNIDITLPLSVFEGRAVATALAEALEHEENGWRFAMEEEIQANWEDPNASLIPGENQILPSEFNEETMVFVYAPYGNSITRGQRAGLITELKTRLDALAAPYAFGTLYGNENHFVIRLSPRHVSRFMLDTLGDTSLYIFGERQYIPDYLTCSYDQYTGGSSLSVYEISSGNYGLRYEGTSDFRREAVANLTRVMLKNGLHKLYLQNYDGIAIAEMTFDQPITDGILEFDVMRLSEMEIIDEENRWILDYVDALLNRTNLPVNCSMRASRLLDAQGRTLFGQMSPELNGLHMRYKDNELALRTALVQILEDQGYKNSVSNNRISYWLKTDLNVDEHLVENVGRLVPELIKTYGLAECRPSPILVIQLVDEEENERCRVILNDEYDRETETIYAVASFVLWPEGRLAPFEEALNAWWADFDAEALGLRKD